MFPGKGNPRVNVPVYEEGGRSNLQTLALSPVIRLPHTPARNKDSWVIRFRIAPLPGGITARGWFNQSPNKGGSGKKQLPRRTLKAPSGQCRLLCPALGPLRLFRGRVGLRSTCRFW